MNSAQTGPVTYCTFCKRETETKVDYLAGARMCLSCGLMLEDNLVDTTAEYTLLSEGSLSSSDTRRVGGLFSHQLPENGLSLEIETNKNEKSSKNRKKGTMKRNEPEDRSLFKATGSIKKWCDALSLDKQILDKAEELFYTLDKEKKTFKGRSVESLASAVIWIACRQCNCPLKPQELSDITQIPIKDMAKSYHLVKKFFPCFSSMNAVTYCETFARGLGIPESMSSLAQTLTSNILERRLVEGRNPRTIAAAAIYFISLLSKENKKTVKEISNVSDIAENTIKTCYRDLFDLRHEIIPKWDGMLSPDTLSKF